MSHVPVPQSPSVQQKCVHWPPFMSSLQWKPGMQYGPGAVFEQAAHMTASAGGGKQTKTPFPLRSQASPEFVQPALVTGLHSDFGTHALLQGPWKQVASAENVVLPWQVALSVMLPSAHPEQSLSGRQSLISVQHEPVMQVSHAGSVNQPVPSQLPPPAPELEELLPVLVDVLLELVLVLVLVLVLDDEEDVPPVAPLPPLPPVPLLLHAPCAKAMPTRPPARRIHG
jgi:hypothetical protein